MDCKANKSRPINQDIIKEVDLTLIFGNEVILCSPNSKLSVGLLKSVIDYTQVLNHSEIRLASITEETFYYCFHQKKQSLLFDIHRTSGVNKSSIVLTNGLILSVMTDSGKYGLILVKDLSESTCKIDACHILL